MFCFLLPIRAPLAFCSPSIISAYKCGLDLHTEVHTGIFPPSYRLKQDNLFLLQRKIMRFFAFLLTTSFSSIRQLCRNIHNHLEYSAVDEVYLSKHLNLKLLHSVFVLHQLPLLNLTLYFWPTAVFPPTLLVRQSGTTNSHYTTIWTLSSVSEITADACNSFLSAEYFSLAKVQRRGKALLMRPPTNVTHLICKSTNHTGNYWTA